MTTFLRLLAEDDKGAALAESCARVRQGRQEARCFEVAPDVFEAVPGAPFSYWAGQKLLSAHADFTAFEPKFGSVRVGAQTDDDFRFVRVNWEVSKTTQPQCGWVAFLKGDSASSFYDDIKAVVNWKNDAAELKQFITQVLGGGHWSRHIFNSEVFFRSGISWALRTAKFAPSCVPQGCIPSVSRYLALSNGLPDMAIVGLWNSSVSDAFCKLRMERHGHPKFIVGVVKTTPFPALDKNHTTKLETLARRAWTLKRTLDTITETSHAFLLPATLRPRLGFYDPSAIEAELVNIQAEIDDIAFDLYGFSDADRAAVLGNAGVEAAADEPSDDDEGDEDEAVDDAPSSDALLSWAVGVAFSRFDWRLATGERAVPPEPEPFDPLPAKSPGMLPDGASPFHQHAGILVDDQGHPHDLARLVEQVLETADAPVAEDVRRWLQKDFFAFHLKRYSKSRRKAPIYWPLATASGNYTLWLYYPSLSDQTLFTAVNDFVDPKLDDVRKELQALRDKGAGRSKQDENRLEALASLEHELADLRDSLLEIAPNYRPNHDDGVQITAAPLWKLFRLKPWQKVLKETWAKLEKGDYDWAHLAINYWPQRVREKCVTDKSLAIAHNLEHLYIEPEVAPKKARGRAKKQDV